MIAELGGGLLFPPNDPTSLADALQSILVDDARRLELGRQGAESVHRRCNAETMARDTWSVFQEFLP
jgi:glycosyltransferase involved in cell wall biosynthesis